MAYGGYGKPDPYSDQMSRGTYGGGSQAQPAMSAKPNGLDYSNLGLNVVGTALQGFGAYQAYQEQERQRREERRRYEEQKRIAEEERRKAEEQQRTQNMLGFGGYAQTMQENRNAPYRGFAARVGI